jgi:hypothetical protein
MNKPRKRVFALIKEHSPVHPSLRRMVLNMCPLTLGEADLVAGIKEIVFDHTPSSFFDDDQHWVAKSPFDNKYYHFAGSPVCRNPTKPAEITDLPPDLRR